METGRVWALTAATLAILLLGAASAWAGEVKVEELMAEASTPVHGSLSAAPVPQNTATLVFAAAPGEQNRVTIAKVSESGGLVQLRVLDAGAPLLAGTGCSGGGAAGAPATCTMHAPRYPDTGFCGHDCEFQIPATGWEDAIRADLGDGNNSFDASSFTSEYLYAYPMKVSSGAGEDRISTGSGVDEIEPGAGYDEVHSGDGSDRVFATPAPDGPDYYDLGDDGFDLVSYAARTAPVAVTDAGGGAPGEGDRFAGLGFVIGGAGDDTIEGAGFDAIQGGPGNDTLLGNESRDWIQGGPGDDLIRAMGGDDDVSGSDGNDTIEGGAGNDTIREEPPVTEGDNLSTVSTGFGETTGNDVVSGGPGEDRINLGPGEDRADGGPGDDEVFGGAGADLLYGGEGDDAVGGEAGPDHLWGGPGNDRVLAGLTSEYRYARQHRAMDGWRDVVDCGGGRDFTNANRWDLTRRCERFRRVPVAKVGATEHLASGEARLPVNVAIPGVLTLSGAGIEPVSVAAVKSRKINQPAARLTVRARGGALAALRAHGRVRVRVRLGFAPEEGVARSEERTVILTRSARGAGV